MRRGGTGLLNKSGKEFFYILDDIMLSKINKIMGLYNHLPEYNNKMLYTNNMIKTTLSDIDIENKNDTSYIDSLAAVCCNKIKNKNQQTALNMLKMLYNGTLDKQSLLTHEYVIEIWRNLTHHNRNAASFENGYRVLGVKLGKGGPLAVGKNVTYVAPPANKVRPMMESLYNFVNIQTGAYDFADNIIKAIVFSAYFVYVHPFSDGNGRISRLLTNKILIDRGLDKFRYISINMEITKFKSEYNRELLLIERLENGDITQYIDFMLNILNSLLERLTNPARIKLNFESLSVRQKKMLQYIKAQPQGISIDSYRKIWNSIAKVNNIPKISVEEAKKDLEEMFKLDLIVYDSRYTLYPGFKYYNK